LINYSASRKNILEVPFGDIEFSDLASQAAWIVPHSLALINKEVILVRNEDNQLISPKLTLSNLFKQKEDNIDWWVGLFKFLTMSPRKNILGELTQNKHTEYSALVPLILSAFKKYRDVQYSEWDWEDPRIKVFVDKDILEALGSKYESVLEKDILDMRHHSMLYKTGAKAGDFRTPVNTYSITGKSEGCLLPRLRKIMECQVWVAHPSLRNNLMILDVNKLDSMPEVLVPEEIILNTKKQKPVVVVEEDLPWDSI